MVAERQRQRIGEYVLDEPVGAGAFGQVWRARHHVWEDRVVAIKIPSDPQYIRQLQREGAVVHGLHHPNIVRAIGLDPFADPPYLVTEYVAGESLRALLARRGGRLAPAEAVSILRQVLAGLAHAHEHGMVHLDIKPENILIDQRAAREGFDVEGMVKVTDFGLGRAVKAAAGSMLYSASLAGDDGDIVGTLDYMAPEQRSAGGAASLDARADLYACGVLLYEMLTGERPAGMGLPSELNPDVPPHLDDAFRRAYARHDRRFASAAGFAAALSVTLRAPDAETSTIAGHRVDPLRRTLLVAAVDRLADLHASRDKLNPQKGKTSTSTGLLLGAAGCGAFALIAFIVIMGSSHRATDAPVPIGVLLVVATGLAVASVFMRRHELRQVAAADARVADHLRRIAAGFPGLLEGLGGDAALRDGKSVKALDDLLKQGDGPLPPSIFRRAESGLAEMTVSDASGANRQAARALLPPLLEQLGEAKSALAEARGALMKTYIGFGVWMGILGLGALVCGMLAVIDVTAGLGRRRGAAAFGLTLPAIIAVGMLGVLFGIAWLVARYHRRRIQHLDRCVAERTALVATAFPPTAGADPSEAGQT